MHFHQVSSSQRLNATTEACLLHKATFCSVYDRRYFVFEIIYRTSSPTVRHRALSNNISRLIYSVCHFDHITVPYDCVKRRISSLCWGCVVYDALKSSVLHYISRSAKLRIRRHNWTSQTAVKLLKYHIISSFSESLVYLNNTIKMQAKVET